LLHITNDFARFFELKLTMMEKLSDSIWGTGHLGLDSLAFDNQTIKEVMGRFFPTAKPFWFT